MPHRQAGERIAALAAPPRSAPPSRSPPPPAPARAASSPPAAAQTLPAVILAEVFALARRLAMQPDLAAAQALLQQVLGEYLQADRIRFRYPHSAEVRLWELCDAPCLPSRDAGVCLYAARRQIGLWAHRARDLSPPPLGYAAEVDDPGGRGDERLMVQPWLAGGQLAAVVLVVRNGWRAEFRAEERALLDAIASACAPIVQHFLFRYCQAAEQACAPAHPLFREQALLHQQRPRELEGSPLRLSPGWLGWSFYLVVAATFTAAGYGAIARVGQYSAGPAFVRVDAERLSARTEGTVARVHVAAGDQVRPRQLLIELHAGPESAAATEAETDYERQLAAFLLDPSSAEARARLASVSVQRDRARALLAERTVRAPRAGRVADLRARPGMHMAPGEHLLSLESEGAQPQVVAFLPGADLPALQRGMELRVELAGHRSTRLYAVIEEIGSEVVGPREAARYLGTSRADSAEAALSSLGPVVVVVARLAAPGFDAQGRYARFHDGMAGQAEARLRSTSLFGALFPGENR